MTETVQVILFKNEGPIAALIRWFTFSRWNHAGIRVRGAYYESTFRRGVTWTRKLWPTVTGSHVVVIDVPVDSDQVPEMVQFLDSQVGKSYDWRAIFALPWRKRWQSDQAWFCSELVAEALRIGGVNALNKLDSYRVTPRDLWLALPN